MHRRILVIIGEHRLPARLTHSATAAAIWEALPLAGTISLWGQELFFPVSLQLPAAPDAREEMAVGELGYWPEGPSLCIFFGVTPASFGREPRAASPVNPFGMLEVEPLGLAGLTGGEEIRLERYEER